MKIFAWILWGLIIAVWTMKFAIIIGGICGMKDSDFTYREPVRINIYKFAIDVAIFVFLSIYIFS